MKQTSSKTDAEKIIQLEKQALRRWCDGDPSGFLEISAPDVVYFDPSLDARLDGLEALRAYYEGLRGRVRAERFELLNPLVQRLGDEAAVLTFNFVSYGSDGGESRWNSTEVYRKDRAGWRIVQTHWSRTERGTVEAAGDPLEPPSRGDRGVWPDGPASNNPLR